MKHVNCCEFWEIFGLKVVVAFDSYNVVRFWLFEELDCSYFLNFSFCIFVGVFI